MLRILLLSLVFSFSSFSQSVPPKLVVGIVIDQMRFDFINRYWDEFSESGFKRLINEGYQFTNTHFNYIPTYTAPGHASIYTGTTPSSHGVIANSWFDKKSQTYKYCVGDENKYTLGADNASGKMSPQQMLNTTIGDELRLFTMNRSKVIGIGLKDRSAILPAGHMGNYAFWFDSESGDFVSSSYYSDHLPKWLSQFNKKNLCEEYLSHDWDLLLDSKMYDESLVDNSVYEEKFLGEKFPKFPHRLPDLLPKNGLGLIKATPFGSSLTKDLAIAVIEGEDLGSDRYTDLLAVSFSSPDYVGHQFGADSKEIQDTYLRLDRDLSTFLLFLDQKLGSENFLVFLTSDHGAVRTPSYLSDVKVPSGYFDATEHITELKVFLRNIYGPGDWVKSYSNAQIYLNKDLIFEKFMSLYEVQQQVADFMLRAEGVKKAICGRALERSEFQYGDISSLQKGYNPKRSGDVLLILDPAWIEYGRTGTTHGSGYAYDQHVPLIWFGWKIKAGRSNEKVAITDIASTLSNLLGISFPNGSQAKVLSLPFIE